MPMRVRIDPQKCQGHQVCVTLCPEVFEVVDGYGSVKAGREEIPDSELTDDLRSRLRTAVQVCPLAAISAE